MLSSGQFPGVWSLYSDVSEHPIHSTHTYLSMKMEQSVPKRRHINSRRRGITQKKAYNKFSLVQMHHNLRFMSQQQNLWVILWSLNPALVNLLPIAAELRDRRLQPRHMPQAQTRWLKVPLQGGLVKVPPLLSSVCSASSNLISQSRPGDSSV